MTIYLEATLILMIQSGKEKEVGALLAKGEQKTSRTGLKYLTIEEDADDNV